jgi:hypothetical protein
LRGKRRYRLSMFGRHRLTAGEQLYAEWEAAADGGTIPVGAARASGRERRLGVASAALGIASLILSVGEIAWLLSVTSPPFHHLLGLFALAFVLILPAVVGGVGLYLSVVSAPIAKQCFAARWGLLMNAMAMVLQVGFLLFLLLAMMVGPVSGPIDIS